MKSGIKVLLVSDFHVNVYCWRKEIIEYIIDEGGEVALAVPYGDKLEYFRKKGCQLFDVDMNRQTLNIFSNIKLLMEYKTILDKFKPDVVLLYGSKGMLYSGFWCRLKNIKYIVNINGLGITEYSNVALRTFILFLYKLVVPKANCVFFQNKNNMDKFRRLKMFSSKNILIPGSGVNTQVFSLQKYICDSTTKFLFCARVMREKGINEYIEAAKIIKNKGYNAAFSIIGMCDDDDAHGLLESNKQWINYYGFQSNVIDYIKEAHCVVLPSFYGEGISNSLLESAALGRAIITTDMPGCRETVEDYVTGYLIKPRDVTSLVDAMIKFINMSDDAKEEMGIKGRERIIKMFDRTKVVEAYSKEL